MSESSLKQNTRKLAAGYIADSGSAEAVQRLRKLSRKEQQLVKKMIADAFISGSLNEHAGVPVEKQAAKQRDRAVALLKNMRVICASQMCDTSCPLYTLTFAYPPAALNLWSGRYSCIKSFFTEIMREHGIPSARL